MNLKDNWRGITISNESGDITLDLMVEDQTNSSNNRRVSYSLMASNDKKLIMMQKFKD